MNRNPLTGAEKAAVLLRNLPTELVEKVLRRMDARQAGLMKAALAQLEQRPDLNDIQASVLDETFAALASVERKRSLQAFQPEGSAGASPPTNAREAPAVPASSVDIRLDGNPESPAPAAPDRSKSRPGNDAVAELATMPPNLVATALQGESAKTIGLLMNTMEVELAGNVFKRLDPAKRKEVSMQFTATTTISDDVLQRIAQAVLRKCQALRDSARALTADPSGREKRMASLLRGLDRTERMETVAMLEASDAELAARVKVLLYQFDDILRMENVTVRKLLTEVDTRSLAVALVGAAEELQAKIYGNLSKRAQDSLREEIELAGKVPKSKISEAQQQVADAIQRLDQRGELVMIET